MKKVTFGLLIVSTLLCGCLQKGYVKYTNKVDEVIATQMIKDYIKENPNPSIVLKVPVSENRITQSDPNSYMYNAIEKELLNGGFDVKDRSLFNEVIGKSKEINYSEIQKLTGTDLILELVHSSTKEVFTTNRYYRTDGSERISTENTFDKYGAVIEFKLTLIEKNQYAGSYLFNYVPCTDIKQDCECEVAYKTFPRKEYLYLSFCNQPQNTEGEEIKPFEVSPDVMGEFVRNGVKQMVAEIRK